MAEVKVKSIYTITLEDWEVDELRSLLALDIQRIEEIGTKEHPLKPLYEALGD